ncbi:fatty acid desaturase family protein [Paraburkholderia saeva]|uniref:Fatty acid desaturase domain-containing protein n=1 Tax=Paraburkholderia saeva TaxID=2777537 RepID=A0A9N8RWC7_9BURK|nr:fatty acid desaturase [Paraburkholderia saeva]CAG4896689.1 hypothetical protein LMG31841_02346 [Paraburkholderia saeva]
MNLNDASSSNADRILIKQAMLNRDPAWRLPRPQTWRVITDITVDWMVIALSVWATYRIGWAASVFALVVIGNRQRALGNLLHEAGHGNLSAHRETNDALAHFLLAPPLLNSLSVYREQHAHHHAWLGHPERDPDLLPQVVFEGGHWYHAYLYHLATFSIFRGSIMGHLAVGNLTHCQRFAIFTWWIVVGLPIAKANPHFALMFCVLWFGARATVFHAITTFREMTDHYGLKPGGTFNFTREIPDHGLLSVLLHPHHNGYHLTHHLFPTIPYHQLPRLHARLMKLSDYKDRALVCHGYLKGSSSSVAGWGANHG